MLLKGEALISTFTIAYSAHGGAGAWTVSVTAPGNIKSECETEEATPYPLLDQMLNTAFVQLADDFQNEHRHEFHHAAEQYDDQGRTW